MCRWRGCARFDSTHMCKWCGTRYCKECLHGDFPGLWQEKFSNKCRVCFQIKFQGPRVEYIPGLNPDDKKKGRSRSASSKKSNRSASAKRSKSGKTKKKRK